MTKEKGINIDSSCKGIVKWGGLSLLVSAFIPFLFIFGVAVSHQTLPIPAEEALENPVQPTLLFVLAALGELLLMPGMLALYFTLKKVNKTAMFIATALWLLCVPMFLVSRGLIISLSLISSRYMDTIDPAMKAAYLASAELALETQNIYSMMGLFLLCAATIIIGAVMLKGRVFGKISYLLIAAGIFTIFSPIGVIWTDLPDIFPFIGILLGATWQMIAGFKLYKLGKDV